MLGGAPGGAGLFVFEPAGVGAGLFVFRFERFEFVLSDSPLRLLEFAPPLVLRFEPALLLLALTFAPARLAFAFSFSFALPGLLSLVAVSEPSPSFAARLTSTATVWPPFTSSPARGN